ncbi:hypothetical protein SAMD00019534_096610 [Acytostelium subglobosum LB1]|uniref:hypothetical protein n=1 Tax=Acytostelium subglobosum LB1 TaxID=1410327 RepID=UPI000644EC52|nr:hypothetical protein SAMD00019534_096610 [Acytostelium subglobosum LB1]GAM26486.1 hypothetical protein SAMD00019534_096610 [Acytostelium subglobosum LB1]|eukprot:XP_012750582.1 hypothetical protein SAMD00019534_096610 [Acytostelium subglobosum LB1]
MEFNLISDSGVAEPFKAESRETLDMMVVQHFENFESFVENSSQTLPTFDDNNILALKDNTLHIAKTLFKSDTTTVYKAESSTDGEIAAKVQSPAVVWAYYIYVQLLGRLGQDSHLAASDRFLEFYSMHHYRQATVAILQYLPHGSLHNMLNKMKQDRVTMEEPLKMFLAIELLRTVETMHQADIIHSNISPSNMFVTFGGDDDAAPDQTEWTPDNTNWRRIGLKLGSFSLSIDLQLYGNQVRYTASRDDLPADCGTALPAVLASRGPYWSHDIDYLGVAQTLYFIVSDGNQLDEGDLTQDSEGQWHLDASKLRASLQTSMWVSAIDQLLNQAEQSSALLCKIRDNFGAQLASNPTKLKSFYRQIRKLKIDFAS